MRSSPRAVPTTTRHSLAHNGDRLPARSAAHAMSQPPLPASCGCTTRRPEPALATLLLYSVIATLLAIPSGARAPLRRPRAWTKSMLCARSSRGEKSRSLCRRKAGHTAASSGNSARAMASSRGRSRGATQYHTCAARRPGLAPAARCARRPPAARATRRSDAQRQPPQPISDTAGKPDAAGEYACKNGGRWPAGDAAALGRERNTLCVRVGSGSVSRALGAPKCR
jgi:hypothetical protein